VRQLRLTAPAETRDRLDDLLERHDAHAVRVWELAGDDVCAELTLTNRDIGEFLADVDDLGDITVTMAPQSVLTLDPDREQAPDDLVDVEALSPQEVYLAGLQSVGSWTGFLGYAAVAGAVVWIGMLLNSVFLLIAAMLIAPFAGPAMNTALATATGDGHLLRRTVVRYAAAIAAVVAVVAALHALLGTEIATNTMTETANISSVAVLLPLVAGAAGALNLMQAERSSLVSGAATGVLVAAALAPPAGLVGMAAVIGEWSMVGSGAFLLALQLAGLNLSGALIFRLFGVAPGSARYSRGSRAGSWAAIAASVVVLAALVGYQLSEKPTLQRSSVQTSIAADISKLVNDDPDAGLVEVSAGFTRPDIPGQDTLLGVVYVQPMGGADPDELEERLGRELSRTITERYEVVALVTVTAIPAP
jgi:uncharacterized membrane protein